MAGEGQVRGARVHRSQHEPEKRQLLGIGGLDERLPGERRASLGVADDERLGKRDQDRHLPRGPAGGHAPGRSHPCAGHGSQRKRSVLAVAEGVVGLDERVELARPLVDDRRLRVAQVALDRELVRVAVGAVDLDRVERGLDRVLGGVPLGEAGLAGVAEALVLEPRGAPDEEPAHLGAGGHLGDELLDQLVLADLLAEGVPLVGVADRRVETGLGEADRAGRDGEPALVDGAHRDEEALALLADPVLDGHRHVVEVDEPRVAGPDAELAVEGAGRQTRHPALEHERGHALVLPGPVDRREDQEVVGEVGQGDPDLLAVEPVGVAVAPGGGLQVGGVGADARFGQPERGELLAARLRHQPALALLLGAPLEEGQRVEADVDALDDTERGVGTFELLAQDAEARVVHPAAAVGLGDRRAQEAELAHLLEQLAMDLFLRVPVADERDDLGLGEGPHALLDQPVLVGQGEVDHALDRSRAPAPGGRPYTRPTPEPRSPDRPMTTDASLDYAALAEANLTPVLGRYFQRSWSHGVGHRLYDSDGRAYLDFANGIAVTSLGHAHPRVTAAIHAQVDKLIGPINAIGFAEPISQLAVELAATFPAPLDW